MTFTPYGIKTQIPNYHNRLLKKSIKYLMSSDFNDKLEKIHFFLFSHLLYFKKFMHISKWTTHIFLFYKITGLMIMVWVFYTFTNKHVYLEFWDKEKIRTLVVIQVTYGTADYMLLKTQWGSLHIKKN